MRPTPNRAVPLRAVTGARGVAAQPCGEEEAARAFCADFPGFRRTYAHDPFGDRLEFLQPA